ncbi:hypothetical protein F8M41_022469 [Gigaspora margarita]|uniref:Zn(2)-C6 fungal-type domain-containing protein n=1 Tax=Gigaspora margarita TaxID=4874 RepID=A0A8H4EHY3_GIGMA|nr:hypothetical protein F8M41_022469 [Gigaspora margarita]
MPRTHATLACIYCQKRHERCERLSEEHTCMNCRKRNRPCISVPGYKRGPKTRKLIIEPFHNINPYETTEIFQTLSYSLFVPGVFMPNIILFPANDLHSYNNTIIIPLINPYETTKTLQNTFNNQSSSYNNDEPELNNDQNITPSSDSFSTSRSNDSFFFETQHSYDNAITIPNIDPCGTIETFQNINQSPSSSSSSSSFIHDEPEPNHEQNITSFTNSFPTSCSNDFSSFETQHSYNNVITTTPNIGLYETIETFQDMPINQSPSTSSPSFIHDELELNNERNIISSSSSFSTSCSNDSFFFETQHSYNNIITTTPNIDSYGSVETFRNTFNPHHHPKPSVHDEPMLNDE